jgi:PAS domain S-box-containing protein
MSSSGFSPAPKSSALPLRAEVAPPGEHVVYFYQESDALLESLTDFIGAALGAGNGAIIIASKVHLDGLQHRLKACGLDTQKASSQGRYLAFDASALLSQILVNGIPDEERFATTVGKAMGRMHAALKGPRPAIAVFGEMVALLWTEGKMEAAIRLEQLWNELAKKYSFSLRCAYPMANCQGEKNIQPIVKVCAEHTAALFEDGGGFQSRSDGKIELRRTEERFRLLVDAVQDYAIFMLDVQGHVSSWNTGAQRIKGYAVSEIIGKHFSIFYPEEDLRNGKPAWELEMAIKDGRFEDEGWRLRKDGSRFWANVIISAIRDESGRLIGFGKVTRDFTEKVRTSEALQKEVAERREAQQKLHDSEKSLRQLSLRLLQTQDEERRRIGRDLHDSVGQYLVGLKMKVDSLKSSAQRNEPRNSNELAECSQLIEEAISEVRTISYLLYPPMLEELGLKSAVPWYLDGFTKRSGIKTSFEVSPEFDRISGDLELALFRVLQESLTNVHRHSGSSTAIVRLLAKDQTVILQVIDQGKGTQSKNLEDRAQDWMGTFGVGLRGMNERLRQLGGTLELFSSQEGTTVSATLPLPNTKAEAQ